MQSMPSTPDSPSTPSTPRLLIDTCGHTLAEYEQVIQRGLATFVEVGEALMAIRDQRLYQAKGYRRFEDYCQAEWDMKQSHAYRMMDAAQVSGLLESSHNVGPLPENARQAAELEPVEKKAAADRQGTRTDLGHGANLARSETGKSRDKVADAVDISGVRGALIHGSIRPVLRCHEQRRAGR